MKPFVVITDTVHVFEDFSMREKTVAFFGYVLYRRSECYPIQKDKPMGFTSGMDLTYVEDERD